MRAPAHLRPVLATAALLCLVVAGCGNTENTFEPLLSKVGRAQDVQALSSLEQALASASLVRTESGGSYGRSSDDLAVMLQERDRSHRYVVAPSVSPDQIQVAGGGPSAMLVVRSTSNNYLAVWLDGSGTIEYYRGLSSPQYVEARPSGGGWSETPPA